MVSFPMILLVSVVLGFLAGLGVGGGSLLLLWLTQVMLMPQPQARILNLLFYLPAAGASILFRQRRQIPWDVSITGILTGCTAAAH